MRSQQRTQDWRNYSSSYKKDDEDDNDGKGGGGPSGSCGGAFSGLGSDASRFIF